MVVRGDPVERGVCSKGERGWVAAEASEGVGRAVPGDGMERHLWFSVMLCSVFNSPEAAR